MARTGFVAVAVGLLAAGLLAAGGRASAAADEQRPPSCLGVRATIVGTARADVLRGTERRDVVVALGGSDRVFGRGGDDLLCGGAGDDILDGGSGDNRLHGGSDWDRCRHFASSAACEMPASPIVIEGVTLDGNRISLADFRGRPVFVNLWGAF
jgi:hypothetical protein